MENKLFKDKRRCYMETGEIFFWTATINKWQKLLQNDDYKRIIINSLNYLSDKNMIDVYAFVIMPNHLHLIWRAKQLNGKETPQGSFLKYTAHEFKKLVKVDAWFSLNQFAVDATNKHYEFWQRDPYAVHLFTKDFAFQKLDYIHLNPCTECWQLAFCPSDYFFSSAGYYETGSSNFSFLKDLRDEFC